ncbi:MAG: hypothetical protein HXK67_02640 [Clostridiales bacterium]|nr:hypothetical protein [Clostridiales bacterium]
MAKKNIMQIIFIVVLVIVLCIIVRLFIDEKNTISTETNNNSMLSQSGGTFLNKPNGDMSQPGVGNNANVLHNGATEISSDTTNNLQTYSSTEGSQNAFLVTNGTSKISNAKITKSGNSNDENSDFYGTNAAVLVKNGTLNIDGGSVTTNGSHANGVFAYANGTINLTNTNIKTTSNNSGAIMVTGGGKLNATNVTAETDGNSSAPIRSDRGGGIMIVNGGKYTANGIGSPVIYSTANVTVNNATLISTKSEGAVVEGKNSITLNNVNLTDTNTTLNGNSETYKNIFIYQSMSGDADEGLASFSAKDSTITTNKGDTIFVTNTKATISLTNNKIINNDSTGAFLRIQSGKWGRSGSNGGDLTLNANNQIINGDIFVDNISTLNMKLTNGSNYTGKINGNNTAKNITLSLDSTSKIKLTGDTYVNTLEDADSSYSNINFNGYKLYVNGIAINK